MLTIDGKEPYPMTELHFTCAGLEDGGIFPLAYTGRGADQSPAFRFQNLSREAETLAVTLEDLSHPIKNFTHWVIWNLPAAPELEGGIPAGTAPAGPDGPRQGLAYGLHRYAGPKPPKGHRHRYRFTIYALDCRLRLSALSGKRRLLKQAEGHILQTGSITGLFE